MEKIYQVLLRGPRGEKQTMDLCNTEEQFKSMTVLQLKEKTAEKVPYHPETDDLRLKFTDKVLDGDSKLLSEFGIQDMSIIEFVLLPRQHKQTVEKIYQVEVIGPRGEKQIIYLCNTEEQFKSMTVLQLKQKIARTFPSYTEAQQELMFRDQELEDSRLLSSYGIKHKSTIRLEKITGWCSLM